MSKTAVREITNAENVIDSREIIERIEYLEDSTDEEEQAERKALLDLQEQAEGYCPDWRYGAALIRDSYMKEHAQETAEDCGMIQKDASWPNTCIDWEEATEQFKQDYTAVEFDGVTYWVR